MYCPRLSSIEMLSIGHFSIRDRGLGDGIAQIALFLAELLCLRLCGNVLNVIDYRRDRIDHVVRLMLSSLARRKERGEGRGRRWRRNGRGNRYGSVNRKKRCYMDICAIVSTIRIGDRTGH